MKNTLIFSHLIKIICLKLVVYFTKQSNTNIHFRVVGRWYNKTIENILVGSHFFFQKIKLKTAIYILCIQKN